MISDLGLNWYGTSHRNYDPTIGRFWGIDAMADLFPSLTPMIFGYNNPIMFNDPLGLFGEGGVTKDGKNYDVDGGYIGAVTVTAARQNADGSQDFTWLYNYIGKCNSPISRFVRSKEEDAHRFWHTNRTMHWGKQPEKSKWMKDFNNVFGTALNVGVTGTIVAAFGTPMLARTLAGTSLPSLTTIKASLFGTGDILSKGYLTKSAFNMTVETGNQWITSPASQLDFADIASQGFLGLNTPQSAAVGAVVDFKPFADNYSFINLNSGTAVDFTTSYIAGKVSGISGIQNSPAQPFIQWGADLSMKVVSNGSKKAIDE